MNVKDIVVTSIDITKSDKLWRNVAATILEKAYLDVA